VGARVQDTVPDLWPAIEPLYRRALAGETVQDAELSGVGAQTSIPVRHWLVSYYPVRVEGEVIGVGVIVNDITDRRLAERALSVRNDLYNMLSRTSRAASWARSSQELYRDVCRIAVETGQFRFAWIGVPDGDRLAVVTWAGNHGGYLDDLVVSLNRDDPRSQGPSARTAMTGHAYITNDFLASPMTAPWHASARRAGIASSATFPLKERGQVVAVLTLYATVPGFFTEDLVATLDEITPAVSSALDAFVQQQDRMRDEADLRLRDRAIQAVSQGIVIVDPTLPDRPIVFASPGFEQLTGYEAAEVLGRNCRFLQGPETDPAAVAAIRRVVAEGRGCTTELLNYRKDGTPFWNELTISPVRAPDGGLTHLVGVQTDVTERHRLEEHFRQAQKMEAVGQLAGGVAHDFNNLLTVINGSAALLLTMPGIDDEMRELLGEIAEAGTRAGTLTRQLLAFSRRQVLAPTIVNLNDVVIDTEKMLRRLISENVALSTRLDASLGHTRADPSQLAQILLNLAVNSRDAMPSGGAITIATGNVELLTGQHPDLGEIDPGSYVTLTVTDTGIGMDEATRRRMFEPFFTTKGIGEGTGLGLATVHGIVKQSRGHISVSSAVGRGTSITIYLPTIASPVTSG
jgi:PAS domain S-box-containing protein